MMNKAAYTEARTLNRLYDRMIKARNASDRALDRYGSCRAMGRGATQERLSQIDDRQAARWQQARTAYYAASNAPSLDMERAADLARYRAQLRRTVT